MCTVNITRKVFKVAFLIEYMTTLPLLLLLDVNKSRMERPYVKGRDRCWWFKNMVHSHWGVGKNTQRWMMEFVDRLLMLRKGGSSTDMQANRQTMCVWF